MCSRTDEKRTHQIGPGFVEAMDRDRSGTMTPLITPIYRIAQAIGIAVGADAGVGDRPPVGLGEQGKVGVVGAGAGAGWIRDALP